jgi:aspartate racemase
MPPRTPYPMNDVYRWDPAEGVIGVLGVAPLATLDFYRRLTLLTTVRKDWEHVRVLIDSNPKLPSRGRHLQLGETDPSPFIRDGIDGLLAQGAVVVAVPCNTAHILYERYARGIGDVVPNMVALTVAELCQRGTLPQRVAVLGSRYTLESDLYGQLLRAAGHQMIGTAQWQAEISALIEHVKQGGDLQEGTGRLHAILAALQQDGASAFIVACTELSALCPNALTGTLVLDASDVLARHCLRVAKTPGSPILSSTREGT